MTTPASEAENCVDLWLDQAEDLRAALSTDQLDSVARLRHELRMELAPTDDDRVLVRFLMAREWQYNNAMVMLRDHLKWRRDNRAANVLADWTPPEALLQYMPDGWQGLDIHGNPVLWEFLGGIDPKGLMRAVRRDDIARYRGMYRGELALHHMRQESERQHARISRVTVVLDLQGVGLSHLYGPFTQIIRDVVRIFEANYPQTLKYCIVINAPSVFPMAYALIKPFLADRTRKKVVVLRKLTDLAQYIAPVYIPAVLGGEGPDPGSPGCAIRPVLGKVPPSLFLTDTGAPEDSTVTRQRSVSVAVGRAAAHEHVVAVELAGATLAWEFRTESCDIGFGLFFKSADGQEELLGIRRVDSYLVPEAGSHLCAAAGAYVLHFDNTYSWTRAKTVLLSVQVLPPPVSS